ncbi:DUF1992 domain-containing protein [Methyloterricola oryzae]|uniref:DnaJ family domain-containing protein n=1 Tax=Methyloterricola oryzae TaxID=1495050 RepID=UPI0005EB5EA8|nr:DUF1992 domain-containing protein [Methyloterricola oryzae]
MLFLERLAEQKIAEALERGELDDLPGKGKPIPPEEDLHFVPADMRLAFRILKNSGYIPEEVQLLRDIDDLLSLIDTQGIHGEPERKRLRLLMERLGAQRGGNLALADHYFQRISEKLKSLG